MIKTLTIKVSLFAAAVALGALSSASSAPAIKVHGSTFDFGKTLQHVKVTHDFVIESVGTDTLVITRVVPGCGCTRAPLKDSVLAPGESTVLSIIFSTKSYAGKITKRPYLMTNVSDERVQLTITADVMIEPRMSAPLKITPFEIQVSTSARPQVRPTFFLIENQGTQDLDVTLIDHDAAIITPKLPEKIKAGETVQGTIEIRKEAGTADFEKSVTFEISDANRTRYSLPVSRLTASSE